jgi:hypothetical protein
MACPCCTGSQCCCKDDGTVVELAAGETCDGTVVSKPAETCSWNDATLTFTVCGISATAAIGLWSSGAEPAFTPGDGSGQGSGISVECTSDGSTLTATRFTFDTGGIATYCVCNIGWVRGTVEFALISASGQFKTCFFIWTVSECGTYSWTQNPFLPSRFCCPDACELSVSLNLAP